MNDTDLAQLRDKVEEIRGHLDAAKAAGWSLNEADTEHKIIDPLLHALGYGPFDIRKRGHDSVANNFPDYTLLPLTPQKWFLEVKKLDLSLQDGEAAQAVNYANNQGSQWAVLTNGRRWFIYNAHLPKPLAEKKVFEITDLFGDDSSLTTLALLSRTSMLADGLSDAWAFQQVQSIVKAQMETPHSPVRKHLRKIASDETGAAILDVLIEQALHSLFATPIITPPPPPPPIIDPAQNLFTYAEIVADYDRFNNKQPKGLRLGSDPVIPVTTWKQANELTTTYLCEHYGLPPLPFPVPDSHGACYINTSPNYFNGQPFINFYTLAITGHTVYINQPNGVWITKKHVARLFDAVGAPKDIVKVSIRP